MLFRSSRSGAGGPFEDIALAQPNSGSYPWTVTSPYTSDAFLKVTAHDVQGHTTPDLSDAAWTITTPVGVPETRVAEFALAGIVPNPSKGQSDIYYDLPREAAVRLTVLDLQGRVVTTLADGTQPAGRHVANWKGIGTSGPVRTGLYFVRFRTPVGSFMRRLLITR